MRNLAAAADDSGIEQQLERFDGKHASAGNANAAICRTSDTPAGLAEGGDKLGHHILDRAGRRIPGSKGVSASAEAGGHRSQV